MITLPLRSIVSSPARSAAVCSSPTETLDTPRYPQGGGPSDRYGRSTNNKKNQTNPISRNPLGINELWWGSSAAADSARGRPSLFSAQSPRCGGTRPRKGLEYKQCRRTFLHLSRAVLNLMWPNRKAPPFAINPCLPAVADSQRGNALSRAVRSCFGRGRSTARRERGAEREAACSRGTRGFPARPRTTYRLIQ